VLSLTSCCKVTRWRIAVRYLYPRFASPSPFSRWSVEEPYGAEIDPALPLDPEPCRWPFYRYNGHFGSHIGR